MSRAVSCHLVDIETEWNLKKWMDDKVIESGLVDIETEWNLKDSNE